jgi:hypothetical protein
MMQVAEMVSVNNGGVDVVVDDDKKRDSFTCVSQFNDEDASSLDARDNDIDEGICLLEDDARDDRRESNNNCDSRRRKKSFVQTIIDDFHCPSGSNDGGEGEGGGDRKILRAICRTATVNAAIFTTAATGGAALAPIVGFATGGAIAAKRLSDGILTHDNREITKSVTVFGGATCASMIGQAVTTTVMMTVFHAALPLVAVMALGVGCCSGITAGAVSEWTVDSIIDNIQEETNKCVTVGSSSSGTWNELKQTWKTLISPIPQGNSKTKSNTSLQENKSPDQNINQEAPVMMSTKYEDKDKTNTSSNVTLSSQHSHQITPHSDEHKKIIASCNRGMIRSTKLLTTDIAQLATKKANLHEILRKYEDDFYKVHQRQVSSFDDIEPFENVYRQYKEIEIAIDIKKKQEHSGEEAISFWGGGWRRHLF